MTRALTIRLDDQLAERLRTTAFTTRRHAADIIRTALDGYLTDLETERVDEPIGHIPTPSGTRLVADYRAHRTRQPETTTSTCPHATCTHCGQSVYLEADGRIGWHPVGEDLNLRSCTGSGTRPKANADA